MRRWFAVMNGWTDWGWGWAFVMMIPFWGLVFLAIWGVIRSTGRNSDARERRQDAVEILKSRFARGEIDEPEYLERRKTLESTKR